MKNFTKIDKNTIAAVTSLALAIGLPLGANDVAYGQTPGPAFDPATASCSQLIDRAMQDTKVAHQLITANNGTGGSWGAKIDRITSLTLAGDIEDEANNLLKIATLKKCKIN